MRLYQSRGFSDGDSGIILLHNAGITAPSDGTQSNTNKTAGDPRCHYVFSAESGFYRAYPSISISGASVHRLDDAVLTLQSGQRVDTPLSVYLERGCPIQFINDPAQVLS